MDDPLAYLLALRRRTAPNSDGRALVDRGLALLARAAAGRIDEAESAAELARLRDELALRYGAPSALTTH